MSIQKLSISKIETHLNDILYGVVSDNVFFSSLPDASIVKASDWQDMVLVDIPSSISDFDAYGVGFVFIGLYARPFDSGGKNVAKMSELEEKLELALKDASNENYHITIKDVNSTFDDDINWHCNVITLNILIV